MTAHRTAPLLGIAIGLFATLSTAAEISLPDLESAVAQPAIGAAPGPGGRTWRDPQYPVTSVVQPAWILPAAIASVAGIPPNETACMGLLFELRLPHATGLTANDVAVWSKGQAVRDPE